MKSNVIAINLKKTEPVDWFGPLNHYLKSIYGNTQDFTPDLSSFNKLRQDIRGSNLDTIGQELHYKYYGQLEFLDLRIPFFNIKIDFTWYDAFVPSSSNTQHSLAFEKASVLFNLASLLSNMAKADYDDLNYKDSIKNFQYAAGVFRFLIDNFLHAPSDDLNQQTIKFLNKLMLAQAQEIFVLKLISENSTKYSLLAKLCQSCTSYYSICFEAVNSHALSTSEEGSTVIPAKIEQTWVNLIEVKLNFYKSLTNYYQALFLFDNNKIGEAIAYLKRSSELINSITKKNLGTEFGKFQENIKTQKLAVKEKLAQLEKDNDFVFHDIIPSVASLVEIRAMDSVKETPLNEQNLNHSIEKDFFEKVIPMNIHELNSLYSEEQSNLLRSELENVEISNQELNSVLEYLKLPKALINIKQSITENKDSSDDIDYELVKISNEIKQNDPKNQSILNQIQNLKKNTYSALTSCDSLMNTAGQNAPNKVNFDINSSLYKDEISKAKRSLIDATESDDKLFQLVSDTSLLRTLVKGPTSREFVELFDENARNPIENQTSLLDLDDSKKDVSKIKLKIQQLEDYLSALNNIKRDKILIISNLKKDIHSDDISQILILNSKKLSVDEISRTIFNQELSKFKPYQDQLVQLINKQSNLIYDLKSNWSELLNDPLVSELKSKNAKIKNQKNFATNEIRAFYGDWTTYSEGLAKGLKFYEQLFNFVKSLESNIHLFITNEKNKSIPFSNLSAQFKNLNVNQPQSQAFQSFPATSSYAQQNTYSNQYKSPSYAPSGQFTGTSYNANPSPQLPPKEKDSTSGFPSLSDYQSTSQIQPNQPQTQTGFIYSQPSVYDPDLYSSLGKKYNQNA